jgi:hypothetical protein
MASLQVDDGEVRLHLTGVEKAEAVHTDLHTPRSSVQGVELVEDALDATRVRYGFKIGMRVPGQATVAIIHHDGQKIFVAVHHDTPRGVRVKLAGDPHGYDEWIVGLADPEAVVAALS